MMKSSSPPRLQLLSFALALLLAGVACSHASEGEQAKGKDAAKPADAATAPAPPAGTAAQAAPPAAPSTAKPGAPAAAGPAGAGPTLSPDKLPAVVARINGKEIKKDDLLKEADGLKSQLGGATLPPALPAAFYRQVLDGLIARELLLTDAKAAGITVSEAEVNQQLAGLKSRFPKPEDYQKALAANGLTEATLVSTAREQILVQKYLDAKVMPTLPATSDAAMKTFYDQNLEKMKQPERRHLRHILIKADKDAPAADKTKAKAKADALLVRIKKGEDFAKLAKENSDDGSKDNGGDLSWMQRGQTVPAFEQAAWALKKNEISPVVESQFGYHIIQLLDVQDARVMPFEEVKGRIGEFLKQKQGQDQVRAKIQDLRTKAKVETFI